MKSELRNWEVAVYAVYLLGGVSRRVMTEDLAVKCHELAPDVFSWRKYPNFPDKDVTRRELVRARDKKNGVLVEGRAGMGKGHVHRTKSGPALDGWALTEAGATWISEHASRLATVLRCREASEHRQVQRQKLARIRDHRLFQQFREEGPFNPSLGDMAALFRCRVDADWRTWDKRFREAASLAQITSEKQILAFIDTCRKSVNAQVRPM